MLGISFKALDVSRERRAAIAAARAIRIEDAAKEAQQHVREDLDEWDMVDVEDPDAEAPAPVDLENGKSTKNPVIAAGSADGDTENQMTQKKKVNKIKIEEKEAERIALAVGDDIGDDEKASNNIMVQKSGSNAGNKNPFTENDQIRATDGPPLSNRNSLTSSINVGGKESGPLSDNGEEGGRGGVLSREKTSPLAEEILARLKFLDEEDESFEI